MIMDLEDEEQIREQVKIVIRTVEILYEELETSKLPDEVKRAMLLNTKTN